MSNEIRMELLKVHRNAMDKHVYFLLAAAGAAMAFAITQTQTATLSVSKIPLGLAVACWGASFWCGCRHVWEILNLTQQDYELMRVRDGLHPKFPNDPGVIAGIERLIDEQAKNSGRFTRWQWKLLIASAIFYVLWHIVEMYLRTFSIGLAV